MTVLAIAAVSAIALLAWLAAYLGLGFAAGIVLPYAGFFLFLFGMIFRIARWAGTPVPFRITVTSGQQRSLPWIRHEPLENPHNSLFVALRMLLEALMFRSLFRNTQAGRSGATIFLGSSKWLWLWSLAFHWSLLVIALRHARLFTEPVPFIVDALQRLDGIFNMGAPPLLLTNIFIGAAIAYLFARRVADRKAAAISLFQDYFLIVLVAAVAASGMYLRYFDRVDLLAVKAYATGLVTLRPALPADATPFFYVHLVLVSVLAAAIPGSKIMHMAGVFFSPTRNRAGNSRRARHENPWNPEVKVHTYAEWQEEFRDKLVKSGYELERDDHG